MIRIGLMSMLVGLLSLGASVVGWTADKVWSKGWLAARMRSSLWRRATITMHWAPKR